MIDRTLNYGRSHILEFLTHSAPYCRVLDLGAGKGADLVLARKVCQGAELMGLECCEQSANELVEIGVQVLNVDIERERVPIKDSSVDIVIANQLIEHTKEVFWIFHEITRVLKVNGRLILGVPNLASLHNRLLLLMGRQPTPIKMSSAHVRAHTKRDILRFVDECFPSGYELKGFRGANFYPFPPLVAEPLARFFPSLAWGIFLLLEKVGPYDNGFLRFPIENELETNFFVGPEGRKSGAKGEEAGAKKGDIHRRSTNAGSAART